MPSVDYVLTAKNSGHPSRVISGLGNAAQVESEGRGEKKPCGRQMMMLELEDLWGQHLMGAAQA